MGIFRCDGFVFKPNSFIFANKIIQNVKTSLNMALKQSQTTMYQHSEVKVRLLRTYLEQYLNVLNESSYVAEIFIYDFFCGEGIYENEGKGSPIIILETIKNIHFTNVAKGRKSGNLHCMFNDIEQKKVEKLQKEVDERKLYYPEFGNLTFKIEDYRVLVSQVGDRISKFKNQKAFIFIDPYGYKDIRVSDIENLISSKKSEVLLFLPTRDMFRFEKKGTPQCLKEFINELVPEKQWPNSSTGLDFIENLLEAFRERLGEAFFVDSFVITRDINQFFCLFFFTSHIYGFDRMLHAKWKIDEEEGRGWNYQTTNSLFDSIEKKPNTVRFERKLEQFLSAQRSNGDIYEFTLKNGHLPTHTNQILLKFQNEGRLKVRSGDGSPARKSSFYVNYSNYKSEPNKVLLKL